MSEDVDDVMLGLLAYSTNDTGIRIRLPQHVSPCRVAATRGSAGRGCTSWPFTSVLSGLGGVEDHGGVSAVGQHPVDQRVLGGVAPGVKLVFELLGDVVLVLPPWVGCVRVGAPRGSVGPIEPIGVVIKPWCS